MWQKYAQILILQLPIAAVLASNANSEVLREIAVQEEVYCFIRTQDNRKIDLTPICSQRGPDTLVVTNPEHPLYGFTGNQILLPTADSDRISSLLRTDGSKTASPAKVLSTQFSRKSSGKSFSRLPVVGLNPWVTGGGSSGGSVSSGGGGRSGGPCEVASDVAGDGSRCGGRAASEKEGGR